MISFLDRITLQVNPRPIRLVPVYLLYINIISMLKILYIVSMLTEYGSLLYNCIVRQVGIFRHKKYLQIMKELKICKYTKNTKKQINTEFMAGMTQKELKQPYFHCGPLQFVDKIFDFLFNSLFKNFRCSCHYTYRSTFLDKIDEMSSNVILI